jgi:hypothetical protein
MDSLCRQTVSNKYAEGAPVRDAPSLFYVLGAYEG